MSRLYRSSWLHVLGFLLLCMPANAMTPTPGLGEMTGCWVSEQFDATSLLTSATDESSAQVISEKMLLIFDDIPGTEARVFARIYEWDEGYSYVLGPTYQNGAFNPAGGFLTFGFPMGGLDHVTQSGPDRLLYVHTKSSEKSAMSVRVLTRLDCGQAAALEGDLLQRQSELR